MKLIKIVILIISICLSKNNTEEEQANIFCGNSICHPIGGRCINQTICVCEVGYTTIDYSENHIYCNYKQSSRIKAFLIEIFFGFGLGHFYAGRTGTGVFKLLCYSVFCMCCFTSLYMIKKIREESQAEDHPYVSLLFILSVIFKAGLLIWQVIDSVLFLLNYYRDGKGFQLY